ncbi:hypothetical protein QVD17_03000 [Tagetes erecta]|uniref:Uncharacterized protein n=1 Tax=Tagetes erecta TaxID=13708 RepID=A0AAD8L987_TARER|nr:hypothetical protein QVD17_03000 [Tagetes erecta]
MSSSPSHLSIEKKHWWLTNKKMVDMYVKDARSLIGSEEHSNITSAINLLDAALVLSPRYEIAMEMKAMTLLRLRRFNEVADMLRDYIPSLKMASDENNSCSSSSSSDNNSFARERVKLLSGDSPDRSEQSFKCFSVSDLKKKIISGIVKNRNREDQWRYLILGQACCHLGLMEDAMALLQTGKRIASAAFRRKSVCRSDDSFTSAETCTSQSLPRSYTEHVCSLITHIKLLLRRKTAAIAASEAGLYTESIRHFSKIIDGKRIVPQHFLAECYIHRASSYRSSGRIAESISDCNRTLALDPSSIEALTIRSSLFETIHCFTDSLHDLEHLKLLYNSILRDRKLPGPIWKRQNFTYNEIPAKLRSITTKIEELKLRVASGEINNVDYYALFGLRRGCSRSELERSHLLLTLRHKPDKSTSFIDRCEFSDEVDIETVKDRAKMSGLLLYRLIQKGFTNLMRVALDEEAFEKQRKKAKQDEEIEKKNAFQGVFCRDLAVVGTLLLQNGFNRSIHVKYEGLSC